MSETTMISPHSISSACMSCDLHLAISDQGQCVRRLAFLPSTRVCFILSAYFLAGLENTPQSRCRPQSIAEVPATHHSACFNLRFPTHFQNFRQPHSCHHSRFQKRTRQTNHTAGRLTSRADNPIPFRTRDPMPLCRN